LLIICLIIWTAPVILIYYAIWGKQPKATETDKTSKSIFRIYLLLSNLSCTLQASKIKKTSFHKAQLQKESFH